MAKQDREYKLNEPAREIPGGKTRPSTLVSRKGMPAVGARERVEAALRVHDLDGTKLSLLLREADGPMLRMIARETIASSLQPAIRAKAIAALAAFHRIENINALAQLALYGDDVYVRSHALLALGSTGLLAAVPIVAKGFQSTEQMEQTAAGKALLRLADAIGLSVVSALMPEGKIRNRLQWLAKQTGEARIRTEKNRKRSGSKQRTTSAK